MAGLVLGLLGGVVEDPHRRPDERVADVLHLGREGVHLFVDGVREPLARHLRAHLRDCGVGVRAGRRRVDEGRVGDGERAVPEIVEDRRGVANHRAHGHGVEVPVVRLAVHAEVVIGDVAPAHDRDRVVGDHDLVVGTPVDARRVGEEVPPAVAAAAKGVEGTDLDVGMRRQLRDRGIAIDDAEVVEQHAHAHPAIGGPDDAVGEQVPADVGVPDVVLQIERPFREIGQGESRFQRLAPVAHVQDTRLPRMLGRRRLEEAAQRRRVVLLKRGRRRTRVFRIVGRATSRDGEREQCAGPASEP